MTNRPSADRAKPWYINNSRTASIQVFRLCNPVFVYSISAYLTFGAKRIRGRCDMTSRPHGTCQKQRIAHNFRTAVYRCFKLRDCYAIEYSGGDYNLWPNRIRQSLGITNWPSGIQLSLTKCISSEQWRISPRSYFSHVLLTYSFPKSVHTWR